MHSTYFLPFSHLVSTSYGAILLHPIKKPVHGPQVTYPSVRYSIVLEFVLYSLCVAPIPLRVVRSGMFDWKL